MMANRCVAGGVAMATCAVRVVANRRATKTTGMARATMRMMTDR